MEADLLDFPDLLRCAVPKKKRLAESYTCFIRRASTPASEWVYAALRRDVPGAELCAGP